MINQTRADLYWLRHSTGALIVLLACTVAAAGYMWLQHLLAAGDLSAAAANGVAGLSDIMLVYLLGALLVGMIVAAPFENKSVHAAVLAAPRSAFTAAKVVVAPLAIIAITIPYGIAATVARSTGLEFVPAIPTAFALIAADPSALDAAAVGEIGVLTLVSGLQYAARLAVCIPLAFLIRKPIAVMAIGFAWNFVADVIASAVADVPGLDVLAWLTPYSVDHTVVPGTAAGDLLVSSAVSLGFIAAMGVLAWLLFRRSDVK